MFLFVPKTHGEDEVEFIFFNDPGIQGIMWSALRPAALGGLREALLDSGPEIWTFRLAVVSSTIRPQHGCLDTVNFLISQRKALDLFGIRVRLHSVFWDQFTTKLYISNH